MLVSAEVSLPCWSVPEVSLSCWSVLRDLDRCRRASGRRPPPRFTAATQWRALRYARARRLARGARWPRRDVGRWRITSARRDALPFRRKRLRRRGGAPHRRRGLAVARRRPLLWHPLPARRCPRVTGAHSGEPASPTWRQHAAFAAMRRQLPPRDRRGSGAAHVRRPPRQLCHRPPHCTVRRLRRGQLGSHRA